VELRDYVRVLRKRWRLVALLPLLALVAAAFLTERAVPLYQSSTTFFVSTPASTADSSAAYTGGLFSQQRVKSYADLLSGQQLAEQVAADLGFADAERSVSGKISAQVKPDTVLLTATVTDPSPARAQAIAASLGRQFPLLVEQLERPSTGSAPTIRATVVQAPVVPTSPVSPRPVRNLGLALVLGLLLGLGLAVAREALDSTIKTPEDVREATGVSTLGAIGYDSKLVKRPLVVQDAPRAPRAEAFRQLRTNLQFVTVDGGLRSIVITSSLPAEAKSTTACNLAITLAQAGKRVVLIEGDLRRPRVADYLGLEGAVGLTTLLIGQVELADAVQRWGSTSLDVLTSGALPPNPAELLGSAGMRTLLQRLEEEYDVVVIDAPPLLPVTDAAVLATMTSGALLCVHASKTRREQLARATESLHAAGANILGALLTMAPRRGPDAYYSYGYGYGSSKEDRKRPQLDPSAAEKVAQQDTPPGTEPTRNPSPKITADGISATAGLPSPTLHAAERVTPSVPAAAPAHASVGSTEQLWPGAPESADPVRDIHS
jgi:capsular exopolysaccharide synthesis family protein